jgi:hypothetical protein
MFMAWINGAERDLLGKDLVTNGSENKSSFFYRFDSIIPERNR